uniref:zinc finger protein CONSTANS-LIKE 5 n=1 Tax=Erigeron canadensis TaxID=72917 RepID=UPI001CB98590|nr:zinc finger protein CONSTANS-LIKE 5 [Erigeron canadensis]
MSSDLCEFDGSFFTDPFSLLSDTSSIDILKAFQENSYNLNPLSSSTLTHENLDTPFDELDQITCTTSTTLLSSSPPSHQLENLSLYQMGNSLNSIALSPLEVKAEESQLPVYDYLVNNDSFLPHSYDGSKNAMKMMQRSYSSKSFDRRPNGFPFQAKFDSLIESSNYDSKVLKSNDHDFSANHMRRVCSTGDLQSLKTNQTYQKLSSSPLATEGSFMEEANFKVGRYSQEERKERILRYKAKRTQRNFNKTIKYACRKTLADSRPRIRGRFARNDEPEEKPKSLTFQRYDDEDDEFWMDGLQEEYGDERIPTGQFFSTYIPNTQFHQFTYFPK